MSIDVERQTVMIWALAGLESEARLLVSARDAQIEVRRRCLDAVELLAASAVSPGVPVVMSARLPRMSFEVMSRLRQQAGHVTVIVENDIDARVAQSWGAEHILRDIGDTVLDFDALVGNQPVQQVVDAGAIRKANAQITCMWSPAGSTGRSTIALGLAEAMAHAGQRVLLIDADTCAPSLATALGIVDEISGLVIACRYAEADSLNERAFATTYREISENFWILTGLQSPSGWSQVHPRAFQRVLDQAAQDFDQVVIDISPPRGSLVSDDMFGSARGFGQDRDGIARLALSSATTVAIVVRPDPVGAVRLVQDFSDISSAIVQAKIVIILNRMPRSKAGHVVKEFHEVCNRLAIAYSMIAVPEDSRVGQMVRTASTMRELSNGSRAFRALSNVADELGGFQNDDSVANVGPLVKLFRIRGRHANAAAGGNG